MVVALWVHLHVSCQIEPFIYCCPGFRNPFPRFKSLFSFFDLCRIITGLTFICFNPPHPSSQKVFLKVVVTQTSEPFMSREFSYCLHCRRLRSMSWFYQHKRLTSFEPTEDQQRLFCSRFQTYVGDIVTEVDLLNDLGRLFHRPSQAPSQLPRMIQYTHPPPSQEIEQDHNPNLIASGQETDEHAVAEDEEIESQTSFQVDILA